jgi:hypothetical protein
MGKGSGGGTPTQQTVTQTNLPEYARPYFENIMDRAQALSHQQYVPYENERIASFTPGQQQTQQEVMGMRDPSQIYDASNIAYNAANYQPGQFGPETFTPGIAEQYMSPYMQNVVDIQKREALRDAEIAQLGQNLGAAKQGTYGGARQALLTGERERGLRTQLGDIQAAGSEKAFQQARDAAFRDQQMREQSRQFGAQQGLAGAQLLGGLGTAQQESQLRRLQAQGAVGAEQRDYQQRLLDQAYGDFLRQRDYPMEQLGYFSNLMRGIPVGLSSTQTAYAAPPSAASQIAGTGLSALGLSRLMG